MENAKQNQQRVPQIELPPPLVPRPQGGEPKEEHARHAIKQEKPAVSDPALHSTNAEGGLSERKSRETKVELPVRESSGDAPPVPETAGDAPPVDAVSQQKIDPPSSDGNALVWIGVTVLIGFVVIGIASRSSNPQEPGVAQRTPIETSASTEPVGSRSTDPVKLPLPPSQPAVSRIPNSSPQTLAPDTPTVPSSPRISRVPPRSVSAATPAPKTDTRRNYVWRGRTYYIPPNQMQRFDAFKKTGRTKLTTMEKLTDQINSIGLQMQNADKKTKARLASQRDALSEQHSEASAEYARLVSEMDQLMPSFANP